MAQYCFLFSCLAPVSSTNYPPFFWPPISHFTLYLCFNRTSHPSFHPSMDPSRCLLLKKEKGKAIPWQAWTGPEGSRRLRLPISRQSAHEYGKVVSPTHRPPLPKEIFVVIISVTDWVNPRAIVRPERLCQSKIPVTPSGIEPATFRLVAQCLNQMRHCVSPDFLYIVSNFILQMSMSTIFVFPISEQKRSVFAEFQESKYGTKLNKHKSV